MHILPTIVLSLLLAALQPGGDDAPTDTTEAPVAAETPAATEATPATESPVAAETPAAGERPAAAETPPTPSDTRPPAGNEAPTVEEKPLPPLSVQGLGQLPDLPAPQQQAWLRQLDERLGRALRLTLLPRQAEERKAQIDALLRQPTISWEVLQAMVEDLERRERTAIEMLPRRYRLAVLGSFGSERAEYNRRLDTIDRVLAAWRAVEPTPAHRDTMLDWLEGAVKSSTAGSIAPVPADPTFGPAPPIVSPVPPEGAPMEPGPGTSPGEPTESRPVVSPPDRDPFEPDDAASREPREPAVPAVLPPEPSDSMFLPDPSERRASPDPDALPDGPGTPEVLPGLGVPTEERIEPILPEAPAPSQAAATPMAARPLDSSPAALAPIVPSLPGRSPAAASPVLTEAEYEPDGVARQTPPDPLEVPPVGVERTVVDSVGAAASLRATRGLGLPELHDEPPPAVASDPVRISPSPDTAQAEPAPRHSFPTPPLEVEPAVPPADVNVADLAARIAGANLELRGLEAELSDQRPAGADGLEKSLRRLEGLVIRQRDLAKYYELTPEPQRRLIAPIESPRFVIAQLGRRIFEARSAVVGPGFSGTEAERELQLARLDALSRELAALSAPR